MLIVTASTHIARGWSPTANKRVEVGDFIAAKDAYMDRWWDGQYDNGTVCGAKCPIKAAADALEWAMESYR